MIDLRTTDRLAEPVLTAEGQAGVALLEVLAQFADNDFVGARRSAEALLADGIRFADKGLAGGLTALGVVAWHEGRVADALGLIQVGAARSDADGGALCSFYPRMSLGAILAAMADPAAADVIDALEDEMRRVGDTAMAPVALVLRARDDLAVGRIAAARTAALAALAAAEEVGNSPVVAMAEAVGALAAVRQGDLVEASRLVQQFRAAPPAGRMVMGTGFFIWIEALLQDAQAGPERAVEVLADVFDDVSSHKRLLLQEPAAGPWLVRTALAIGDIERATTVVAVADQLATDNPTFPSVVAVARHAHGLLDRDVVALQHASSRHRHPWARASAAEDAGDLLAERGDLDCGRINLEQADTIYGEIGARRDSDRITAKLARINRKLEDGPARPVAGWESLTSSERRVAGAVAEGLTNPQAGERLFLSRHTVDFHLRHVFRKLGIHSRVELTRIVVTLDADA